MAETQSYRVVRRPLVTEKNMHRAEVRGEYTFLVDARANKVEIRNAVESLFNVKVVRVNTLTKKGTERRFGWHWSKGANEKKAIVKLAEGYKIDLL